MFLKREETNGTITKVGLSTLFFHFQLTVKLKISLRLPFLIVRASQNNAAACCSGTQLSSNINNNINSQIDGTVIILLIISIS